MLQQYLFVSLIIREQFYSSGVQFEVSNVNINFLFSFTRLIVNIFFCIYQVIVFFVCLFDNFCFSCVQAVPPVNPSAKNASCIFYKYPVKDGFCKNIITSLYVYGDSDTLAYGEKETSSFLSYFGLFDIAAKCRPIMRDLYCRYHFPPCDTSLDKPQARRICRKTCEYLDQDICKEEMIFIRNASKTAPIFDYDMINCSLYDIANGGDSPECYQYYALPSTYTTVFLHNLCSGTHRAVKRIGRAQFPPNFLNF